MFIITHINLITNNIQKATRKIRAKKGAMSVKTMKKLYFCTSKGKSHGLV